jgi:2-keto-3-deoxy-L-rhamnonate aldolase RhmA
MYFKNVLNIKNTVLGVFSRTIDPSFIEIIAKPGFDFVILDCEHGPNLYRDLYPLVLA